MRILSIKDKSFMQKYLILSYNIDFTRVFEVAATASGDGAVPSIAAIEPPV